MYILRDLTQFGLSLNEARVYVACIEIAAPEVASAIAKKAKIDRELCYAVLKTLKKKELVRESRQSNGTKLFKAENPMKIIRTIEENVKREEQKLKLAQTNMTEIIFQYYNKNVFKASKFEGLDELKILQSYILKSKDKIRSVYCYDDAVKNELYEKNKAYREEANKIGQKVISIAVSSKRQGIKKEGSIVQYFLPKDIYDIAGEIVLHDDSIILCQGYEPPRGVIIKDKTISNILKMVFDLAIEHIKTIHQK